MVLFKRWPRLHLLQPQLRLSWLAFPAPPMPLQSRLFSLLTLLKCAKQLSLIVQIDAHTWDHLTGIFCWLIDDLFLSLAGSVLNDFTFGGFGRRLNGFSSFGFIYCDYWCVLNGYGLGLIGSNDWRILDIFDNLLGDFIDDGFSARKKIFALVWSWITLGLAVIDGLPGELFLFELVRILNRKWFSDREKMPKRWI